MANWCMNNLKISGASNEIKDFYDNNIVENNAERRNYSKRLIFDYIVPKPKFDDPEKQAIFDNAGWYTWCIENWGTKWNAVTNYINYDTDSMVIEIEFETAWSPPIEWLIKAQSKYPNLRFILNYYDEAASFKGRAETIDGIIDNQVWDMTEKEKDELGLSDVDYVEWK